MEFGNEWKWKRLTKIVADYASQILGCADSIHEVISENGSDFEEEHLWRIEHRAYEIAMLVRELKDAIEEHGHKEKE